MPDHNGKPYAFELRSKEENLRRMQSAVANIAKNTGKTEEQVLKDLTEWCRQHPDGGDIRNATGPKT